MRHYGKCEVIGGATANSDAANLNVLGYHFGKNQDYEVDRELLHRGNSLFPHKRSRAVHTEQRHTFLDQQLF